MSLVTVIDEVYLVVPVEERFDVETLVAVLMKFYSEGINEYNEIVVLSLEWGIFICY